MSFGQHFLDWMNIVVTIRPRTGTIGNLQPAYGALTYHRAYLDDSGVLFRNTQGQQIVSSASAYVQPTECNADGSAKTGATLLSALPVNSEITWPDPSVPGGVAKPTILKTDGLSDQNGLQMWVVHT